MKALLIILTLYLLVWLRNEELIPSYLVKLISFDSNLWQLLVTDFPRPSWRNYCFGLGNRLDLNIHILGTLFFYSWNILLSFIHRELWRRMFDKDFILLWTIFLDVSRYIHTFCLALIADNKIMVILSRTIFIIDNRTRFFASKSLRLGITTL